MRIIKILFWFDFTLQSALPNSFCWHQPWNCSLSSSSVKTVFRHLPWDFSFGILVYYPSPKSPHQNTSREKLISAYASFRIRSASSPACSHYCPRMWPCCINLETHGTMLDSWMSNLLKKANKYWIILISFVRSVARSLGRHSISGGNVIRVARSAGTAGSRCRRGRSSNGGHAKHPVIWHNFCIHLLNCSRCGIPVIDAKVSPSSYLTVIIRSNKSQKYSTKINARSIHWKSKKGTLGIIVGAHSESQKYTANKRTTWPARGGAQRITDVRKRTTGAHSKSQKYQSESQRYTPRLKSEWRRW